MQTKLELSKAVEADDLMQVTSLLNAHIGYVLGLAVVAGRKNMVREILKRGVTETSGYFGFTPLHYAAIHGHAEIARMLIKNKCSVDARDSANRTPLHHAASKGHVEVARVLLSAGAEIEAQDADGDTPLCFAAYYGTSLMIALLLRWGAEITVELTKPSLVDVAYSSCIISKADKEACVLLLMAAGSLSNKGLSIKDDRERHSILQRYDLSNLCHPKRHSQETYSSRMLIVGALSVFREESTQLSRLSIGLLFHVFELLLGSEGSEDSPVVTPKVANVIKSFFFSEPAARPQGIEVDDYMKLSSSRSSVNIK
jgi:hypothetical protein